MYVNIFNVSQAKQASGAVCDDKLLRYVVLDIRLVGTYR